MCLSVKDLSIGHSHDSVLPTYAFELRQGGLAGVQLEDVLGEALHSLVQLVDVDALLLRVVRHGRGGAPARVKAHPRLITILLGHFLLLLPLLPAFLLCRNGVELIYIFIIKDYLQKKI